MRIGIIAEGHADRAVIENIISGMTGLDQSNFLALQPADLKDETDKGKNDPASFGSWTNVRNECRHKELISPFLGLEDNEFIAIQIDSAEAHLFDIERPNNKSKDYCPIMRQLIVAKINDWLEQDLSDVILYAIAIEEIDAWLLTINEEGDSSRYLDAKRRLMRILSKSNTNSTSNYENYRSLSHIFSKRKTYRKSTYLDRNCSLAAFCDEINDKVLPKLQSNQDINPGPEI